MPCAHMMCVRSGLLISHSLRDECALYIGDGVVLHAISITTCVRSYPGWVTHYSLRCQTLRLTARRRARKLSHTTTARTTWVASRITCGAKRKQTHTPKHALVHIPRVINYWETFSGVCPTSARASIASSRSVPVGLACLSACARM